MLQIICRENVYHKKMIWTYLKHLMFHVLSCIFIVSNHLSKKQKEPTITGKHLTLLTHFCSTPNKQQIPHYEWPIAWDRMRPTSHIIGWLLRDSSTLVANSLYLAGHQGYENSVVDMMWKYSLVNVYITNWKITLYFSWETLTISTAASMKVFYVYQINHHFSWENHPFYQINHHFSWDKPPFFMGKIHH